MQNNDFHKMFSHIEPDAALKGKIIEKMEAKGMKKTTKKNVRHMLAIAACVAVVGISTAFAAGNVISYFQSDKALEVTNMESLSLYNDEIGKSVSKDGYTLTLDNVAADDNFIHVFYTIKSDATPFYDGDDVRAFMLSDYALMTGGYPQMEVDVVINGQIAGLEMNNNSVEGYFEDNYTYKSVVKANIAGLDIPDNFKVELFGELVTPDSEPSFIYEKLFKMGGYDEITEEDKASLWYIDTNIDKSKVKVDTVTKDINKKLTWMDGTLEKVIFSPFGNQLVISTPANGEDDVYKTCQFALFDENDKYLDVLNTDMRSGAGGSSRNSFEFLKADKDLSRLKLVPVIFNEHGDENVSTLPIGAYPLTYKVNNYGSVVVTDVRFKDGEVDIDYYKDGFVMFDPGFYILDADGNNAEPGGKLGCVLYHDVHYNTNSYTARYVYDACDNEGNPIPMGEELKAENLKNQITQLGVIESMHIGLDFDNALEVDLK